jgi:REP element-mobilizing transposase RayT
MKDLYPENWPQFYTATIDGWQHLLKDDRYKDVIISCLGFLVKSGKLKVFGFVIMSKHIHFIWQAMAGSTLDNVQKSYKKFTSQQFIKQLKGDNKLGDYEVNAADRKHHFWKRNFIGNRIIYTCSVSSKIRVHSQ